VRPILLVRNDPVDTLGVAPQAFEEAGASVHVLDALDPDAPRPALDEISGVVMFGGSMNVDETDAHPFLKEGRDLTREAVERGVPYLGVCLGAQVLARAFDRPVFPAPVREVGFEPIRMDPAGAGDPLLSHYRDHDRVFQWHQDTLEPPEGSVLLATGDAVRIQAYRMGDLAWGIQFHFEVDMPEIELWLDDFGRHADLKRTWGKSGEEVRAEVARLLPDHQVKGREVFRRFADVVRGVA
jgi:GMP synthase (glutamine-hydrolysing)